MPHPMSEKVLQEILRAFAWDEAALPSENAVRLDSKILVIDPVPRWCSP